MTAGQTPALPQEIMDLAQLIKKLRDKPYVTRADMDTITRAKLRIAFWACGHEGLSITRENLAFVMGSDADEIIEAYDRYLANREAAGDDKTGKNRRGGSRFWEGV